MDHKPLYQKFAEEHAGHEERRQLHAKVVRCQSMISQKTFQLRKKTDQDDAVVTLNDPTSPDPGSTMLWDFPFVVDDCNYCVYNSFFMYRVCCWAKTLQWELHGTGETSIVELFLQFFYDTNTMAPSNTINPPFWELFDEYPTADASGHLLSNNHQTFGKAIRWLEKKFGFNLFPPERRKRRNSLRGYGWRGSVWGIRRRVV